jgi:protein arginine kinase
MVNEEDHLRIQVLRAGFQLKKAWNAINDLDTALEERLDFAFSSTLGYLTACPTNLGTGMRASAMMHLPALVIAGQMDKVVRAVNQLGMVVRGLFGEGSDASGSIFQISNQTTLGESEEEIIKRLGSVLESIIENEVNARGKLLETDPGKLFDKIGRAYGILRNSHLLSSGEAMNLLSLIRLGVDIGVLPDTQRPIIDRLFIEAQPGHLQHAQKGEFDPARRDLLRAAQLRSEFANFTPPNFALPSSGSN